MKMSEEMAVRLHRMMWGDMQRELGDDPEGNLRHLFKIRWIKKHFSGEYIENQCFLCEYVKQFTGQSVSIGCVGCSACPIKWPKDICCDAGLTLAPVHFLNSPIHDILALPARNEKIMDEKAMAYSYYKFREDRLSKASGIPASAAIEDHVAEIRKKEDRSVMQVLENFSGLKGEGCWVIDHVKKIQEKAVEEYFEKTPGAKLATMDVDDAFKQYAKEQTEPLKQMNDRLTKRHIAVKDYLAKQSGLDHDRPVDDHIREIVKNSMEAGATEERDRIQEKIYEVLLS